MLLLLLLMVLLAGVIALLLFLGKSLRSFFHILRLPFSL
jgi:hypothetical protein